MLKLCLGFLVDTLLCVKRLARLSIFIHASEGIKMYRNLWDPELWASRVHKQW